MIWLVIIVLAAAILYLGKELKALKKIVDRRINQESPDIKVPPQMSTTEVARLMVEDHERRRHGGTR